MIFPPLEGKMRHFAANIFYFLQSYPYFKCIAKIKDKPYNTGDGIGLQFPCILYITDQAKFLSVLKQHLDAMKRVNQIQIVVNISLTHYKLRVTRLKWVKGK